MDIKKIKKCDRTFLKRYQKRKGALWLPFLC